MPHAHQPAHLVPPLFGQDGIEDFQRSGRIVSLTVSPRDDGIAVYASPNVRIAPRFNGRRYVR